ncbi:thioredoxin domain-containing protein [Streptomyces sp. V4-01]|uniref:Thioredoxin n=1 Tax=Actinacidiphila polyblastidii TaxID=3110430 RepID=A0ABU7P697_9ACTN|nr:thioredoxin domain-containing protein [Streptomyces sp. V4-01]
MSPGPIDTTDATFTAQVLQAQGPVMVFFWAEWSGGSKMIRADVDSSASDFAGRLTVARLNIDQNTATPPQQNVSSIPALLIFKNGAEVARKLGALSKGQLTEFIEANL